MSVQSLATVADAKLTPASATFEAATVTAGVDVSFLVVAFDTLVAAASQLTPIEGTVKESTPMPNTKVSLATEVHTALPECQHPASNDGKLAAHENPDAVDTAVPQQMHADADGSAVLEANNVGHVQDGAKTAEAIITTPKESELARNNWLELRARVESVDPRVFAFREDPKYLHQCEEAKQRRTLAATPPCTPAWH